MAFFSSFSVRTSFYFVLVSCVSLATVCRANGSARLIEPAMRSSLWRFNPKATINLNDQSLDCGGPQVQFNLNRGRCGVCGDPYHERRENEKGGKYDSGIIARRYRTGSKVTMITDLVAGNGGGYFEVKLCPRNNPRAKVTQACFDRYPLQIKNGKKRRLTIPENTRNPSGLYRLDVKLPKGVACTNCVIQWHYHASNEWGYDSNGRGCMGCGPQTEIYNCADVTIGYYGDAEGKLGPTTDVSVGALAQAYDIYSNGQYGTGVSPLIVNSGINPGWVSANDLVRATADNEFETDDDQRTMAASLNRQSAGFANLFLGDGEMDFDNDNNFMNVPDYYYNNYDDYGLNLNMLNTLMGMSGGRSGESGEYSPNTARASISLRTYGGGSSGSSEEGGMNFRRNFEMNIPSLSRQYNALNGGGSDSSEERGGGRMINRFNNNIRNRQNDMKRLRDALKDIANRQKLRNGLHDIVEDLNKRNNRNNYVDYYDSNGGGSSSSSEENEPRNVPTYFRDRLNRGGGSSSSDCSSEEGGCGGGRVVVEYPQEPEVYVEEPEIYVEEPEVPEIVEEVTTPAPKVIPTTDTYYPEPTEEVTVPEDNGGDDYYPDTGPNRGDSVNDYPNGQDGVIDYENIPGNTGIVDAIGQNDYQTQEDIDFIANRQAELDRWREIEEEERLRKMKERAESWKPPVLPPTWPYNNNNYQTGLFPQQNYNPYSMFNAGMNMNLNLNTINAGLTPQIPTLSRQYSPFQAPNMLSAVESPVSRLSRPFPQMDYRTEATSTQTQTPAPTSEIFSWMPSANEVMTMGASKSPIFSQKVANQYLSPFLTLTQSHPALRCQEPDQLVCVATPSYRNIPNADEICTSKCRSGGACGADYCSCACQKNLVCVHQASRNAPGQLGVPELDMWCTDQCNAGQCPNQLCACNVLL